MRLPGAERRRRRVCADGYAGGRWLVDVGTSWRTSGNTSLAHEPEGNQGRSHPVACGAPRAVESAGLRRIRRIRARAQRRRHLERHRAQWRSDSPGGRGHALRAGRDVRHEPAHALSRRQRLSRVIRSGSSVRRKW
ncbi:hypothetical protein PT2222_350029 [Paraburkholderia tropica]